MRTKLFGEATASVLAGALLVPPTPASARALFAYPLKGQSVAQENADRD